MNLMDIQFLLFLQNIREALGSSLNAFFAFITTISVDYYMVVPALILFWAIDKKKGTRVLFGYGTSILLNSILKATFCVYRPWIRSDKLKPLPEVMSGATGYSFPSGHASSVSGFYGGLISVYRKNRSWCVFFAVMVLLTMFSRTYVGVHTPQDVLVGAMVGTVAVLIVCKVSDMVEKNPKADVWVLAAAAVFCVLTLVYFYYKPYPMDYVDGELLVDPKKMTVDGFKDPGIFFGMVVGWFVERRFIRFDIDGTKEQKVLRCLVGALLYIFCMTAIADPIGKAAGVGVVYFVVKGVVPFLFMTLYPFVFKKIEGRKVKEKAVQRA